MGGLFSGVSAEAAAAAVPATPTAAAAVAKTEDRAAETAAGATAAAAATATPAAVEKTDAAVAVPADSTAGCPAAADGEVPPSLALAAAGALYAADAADAAAEKGDDVEANHRGGGGAAVTAGAEENEGGGRHLYDLGDLTSDDSDAEAEADTCDEAGGHVSVPLDWDASGAYLLQMAFREDSLPAFLPTVEVVNSVYIGGLSHAHADQERLRRIKDKLEEDIIMVDLLLERLRTPFFWRGWRRTACLCATWCVAPVS